VRSPDGEPPGAERERSVGARRVSGVSARTAGVKAGASDSVTGPLHASPEARAPASRARPTGRDFPAGSFILIHSLLEAAHRDAQRKGGAPTAARQGAARRLRAGEGRGQGSRARREGRARQAGRARWPAPEVSGAARRGAAGRRARGRARVGPPLGRAALSPAFCARAGRARPLSDPPPRGAAAGPPPPPPGLSVGQSVSYGARGSGAAGSRYSSREGGGGRGGGRSASSGFPARGRQSGRRGECSASPRGQPREETRRARGGQALPPPFSRRLAPPSGCGASGRSLGWGRCPALAGWTPRGEVGWVEVGGAWAAPRSARGPLEGRQ
jgi:hypothetical protein